MDILIDKPIGNGPGEISAAMVKAQLAQAGGQPIVVRVHSEGGSVFESLAIHDALKAYPGPKKCIIESAAFSAASLICLAFDDRAITENGYVMVHEPSMDDGQEPPIIEKLRKKMLDIYAAGLRVSRNLIERWMADETFLDATECLRSGFVTSVTTPSQVAVARLRLLSHRSPSLRAAIVARLQYTLPRARQSPTQPRAAQPAQPRLTATARWRSAVASAQATGMDRVKAIHSVDRSNPGLRLQMIDEANAR